jgi:hypothetical protein
VWEEWETNEEINPSRGTFTAPPPAPVRSSSSTSSGGSGAGGVTGGLGAPKNSHSREDVATARGVSPLLRSASPAAAPTVNTSTAGSPGGARGGLRAGTNGTGSGSGGNIAGLGGANSSTNSNSGAGVTTRAIKARGSAGANNDVDLFAVGAHFFTL